MISILFSACNERIVASDVDSLGLKNKVKSLDESFYIAYNSFNNIILQKKLYQFKYKFDNDCRYTSVEKNLFCNKFPVDSTFKYLKVSDSAKIDSVKNSFPFTFKEPEYWFIGYKYFSDSVAIVEFYDEHANLKDYIYRKYTDNHILSESKYSGSSELISKSGFQYNSENKLLNKTVFYKNGYLQKNYTYPRGKKIETDNEFSHRYKFNIDGRPTNKKTYKGAMFVSETCFYYNDYGDMIMTQEIGSDGLKKTLYNYTYDSNHNWTLCIEYNYTGNIFVRKREIIYYS
jgi:hypothetical protein